MPVSMSHKHEDMKQNLDVHVMAFIIFRKIEQVNYY